MIEPNHIIEKVFLEVNTSEIKTANSIKNNINRFLLNELFPRLETLFDEYNIHGKVVRFDDLNINISTDDISNLEQIKFDIYREFENQFKRQFIVNDRNSRAKTEFVERRISSGKSGSELENGELGELAVKQISIAKDHETTFLFFIENGYLPWYGKEEYITEFTKTKNWKLHLKDRRFTARLIEVFKSESAATERFVLQFSFALVFAFLNTINHSIAKEIKRVAKIDSVLKENLKVSFLRFLIQVSLFDEREKWLPVLKELYSTISANEIQLNRFAGYEFVSDFKDITNRILTEKGVTNYSLISSESITIRDSLLKEKEELNVQPEPQSIDFIKTEIAVQKAGLVIIHPFLSSFFENIEVLETDGNLRKDKLDVAVQSLHYLATGDLNFFEGNLVFEKYLCGVPLKMPIAFQSLLTKNIIVETSLLLKEVIKHWPALKNTSPDGLRQMFIVRSGKLINSETGYKLIVERKVQDALIEKLQWNISIVKLPWKKELLFVEW